MTEYSYFLLKNCNLFKLQLTNNKIKLDKHRYNANNLNETKILKSLYINFSRDKILKKTEILGLWNNNKFYVIDYYIFDGFIEENINIRYDILKNFINTVECNFQIINIFNMSLETLYSKIFPKLSIKPEFILMKKNFKEYLITLEENNTNKNNSPYKEETKQKNNIKKQVINKQSGVYNIYASDIFDIYIVDDGVDLSVLRVKSLKTSKFLADYFKTNKIYNHFCDFNDKLNKFEIK